MSKECVAAEALEGEYIAAGESETNDGYTKGKDQERMNRTFAEQAQASQLEAVWRMNSQARCNNYQGGLFGHASGILGGLFW